jgi:ABC-type antimicrobial peptide transport system permease subunit
MRRFLLVTCAFIAINGVLAVIAGITVALSSNLYAGAALALMGTVALYAAVLVVLRIRKQSET